ncbi:MAG: nuclease [Candidatus Taylorbacteria bacterium CG11_big_fil_rev_8_21_14_0_20_46_11]|uniref:Nuclease n=1 Tax=Candidatus Taylorbacteria bacterium CG11_big_fil_rev_8_21_14_0_20_46_11 TaxID=1975025 RepID=A0A2H0KC39_9BACT|nr:MAG: nuclease [Candidatus Taylorbacteria bacterium CG11_big_fil_rev_8_21_14_0_20_46_11]
MFIPKKILYTAGIVAVLAIGVFIGSSFGKGKATQPPEQIPEQTAAVGGIGASASVVTDATSTSTESQPSELVRVNRVVDGDTIDVEIDGKIERVRYIGIDTPETVDPRKAVQCFGVEASKKNKELVEGKMVRLEKDITDRDRYKRLLRYVWLDNTLINQTLVEQGVAKSYSYPPDVRYQDRFVEAEKQAREDKLGLWTACTSATAPTAVITPSVTTQASTANPSCTIKGNISASGEKIYHLQGCGSYLKTTIDEKRGEQWFCTEAEAQSGGWRKALNCP